MSRSKRLNDATKDNGKALQAAKDLEAQLKARENEIKIDFDKRVENALKDLGLTDAEHETGEFSIKTEFTSETSLDKIADAIVEAINVIKNVNRGDIPMPAMSDEALDSYASMVMAVAEAAKSSSKVSASLTFKVTHMGPGTYAFLYATSQSISGSDLFGSSEISSTGIMYSIMRSIQDLQKTERFNAALAEYENIQTWRVILRAYLDDLKTRKIDRNEWRDMDSLGRKEIADSQRRLEQSGFDKEPPKLMTAVPDAAALMGATPALLAQSEETAEAALAAMEEMGGEMAEIAAEARERHASL